VEKILIKELSIISLKVSKEKPVLISRITKEHYQNLNQKPKRPKEHYHPFINTMLKSKI